MSDGIKVFGDQFHGAGAGRNNGSARKIVLVGFGKEIEASSAELGNNKVGGCGGQMARGDEIRNSVGDDGLMFDSGVMVTGRVDT